MPSFDPTELAVALLQRMKLGPKKVESETARVAAWIKEGMKGANVPAAKFDSYWTSIAQEAWSWGRLAAQGVDPRGPSYPKEVAPPQQIEPMFDLSAFTSTAKRKRSA